MEKLYELIKTINGREEVVATAYLKKESATAMNENLAKKTTARWICKTG